MADIVNLRRARKAALKREQDQQARENRERHGRPKAERVAEKARAEKAQRDLDAHLRNREDER